MSVLYDNIGKGYDFTRACDTSILQIIRDLIGINNDKVKKVLDIGCGTGNYTSGLCDLGYNIYGLDVSKYMLSIAKKKNKKVKWTNGDVLNMPFPSECFDACICTLACHHFTDLRKAFAEVYRVLNRGRFVMMSCSHQQIRNYWLYRYFPNELEKITTYMPDFSFVASTLCDVGFRIIDIKPFYITNELTDNFLGARFEKPELYLDENFRNGMSIFAKMADQNSVQQGCSKLEKDILSGEYFKYIKEYKSLIGEYYFITVEKC